MPPHEVADYYYRLLCTLKTLYYMGHEATTDQIFDLIEDSFREKFPEHKYFTKVGSPSTVEGLVPYAKTVGMSFPKWLASIPRELVDACLF